MTMQDLVEHLKNAQNNLWYAKNSSDYSSDYINGALDEIDIILKELGA